MDKRPPRPRPNAGPGSGTPEAETRLAREQTPQTPHLTEHFDEWSALGSTRILPEAPTPTELRPDDTALPPAAAEKDITVIGDFRVKSKVGEGAMGAVYKAHQISFNRDVALKILFPHVARNEKLVKRLHREGLIMGQLDHPNIVAAYGMGEEQDAHGKSWHYIAMEYVDGQSLQKWLNRVGSVSVGDALHVLLACARALQYAHENDLVHRDIKPDNVLITRDGQIKVADLGMVKLRDDEEMSLTQTGHAVGTPWYMPLEQAKNAKDTDARCDIYALGCMLYAMLTGEPPFAGKTLVEVIQAKEIGTFPPARSVNSDVPERLDLIISKMTAKLPKYRYQSCAEVIHDLEALHAAGDELEFLKNPARGPDRQGPKQRAAATMSGKGPSSADIEAPKTEDVWYLRYTNSEGQTLVRKMTTPQLLLWIDGKSFDSTAQASRSPTAGFRALATYKEFETAALGRSSKDAVDEKTVRFRNLYKKIEAQELAREKVHDREVSTASYWGGIFLKVAAVCVGVGLLAFFLSYLATGLGK